MVYKNRKKIVILDLGNVVLDWNVERILDSLNLEIDERNLIRKELFFHQDWLDMDHGKESETTVISKICERSTLTAEIVERVLLAVKNSLSPIAETMSLMQEISSYGIEMFCLSNMSCETYDHIKDREFFGMFNGIVISGIEKCMKPDDDIFHLLMNRYELEPEDLFFIDDSLPNIDTANRLGIDGFHFKRSQNCYASIREALF